ncbi:(2Fe-2S)-binding protein [Aquiflexum sp. LQ15W]|uniref:(2Fe-2S)-binding protein n=1 Tax=Cognataquiflexum nitidum TaxID=2922272 RepID=UPI001F13CC05|nr:(2Fe-2S)-binding protein [Cognataquiflexum nitidum]MCH6200389.1 (2Fe-2S)-binding protein [Cognataquiflexum nitidum]
MKEQIRLKLNGKSQSVEVDPNEPFLYVLRSDLELNGPRFGCGLQQCGSCMVLVDDIAEPTCIKPVSEFKNKKLETIEGLEKDGKLHPIQKAFIEEQAAQCGYCLNGMLISAVALLRKNPNPSEAEIKEALNPVICRCGTHSRFIKAVKRAANSSETF